jgi:plastocyanin
MRRLTLGLAGSLAALALAVAPATAGGGKTVKAVDFEFKPKSVHVGKGGKVTWKSTDGDHTVTFKDGGFNKVIDEGERTSKKFKNRGTFKYVCRFHKEQEMRGKVVVG